MGGVLGGVACVPDAESAIVRGGADVVGVQGPGEVGGGADVMGFLFC